MKELKLHRRIVAVALIPVLAGLISGGSWYMYRYLHRLDLKPNSSTPTTGIALVFNPPLKNTAQLEIDDSNEKLVKTISLVRASKQDTAQSINNPLGIRYNVALDEGVYRIKVTSSKDDDFPPFISTVTVSKQTLTTENVSFSR